LLRLQPRQTKTLLVYFYYETFDQCLSFIAPADFLVNETDSPIHLSRTIQRKLSEGKELTAVESNSFRAHTEIHEDLAKSPSVRRRGIFKDHVVAIPGGGDQDELGGGTDNEVVAVATAEVAAVSECVAGQTFSVRLVPIYSQLILDFNDCFRYHSKMMTTMMPVKMISKEKRRYELLKHRLGRLLLDCPPPRK
jgi:hypothetical protein